MKAHKTDIKAPQNHATTHCSTPTNPTHSIYLLSTSSLAFKRPTDRKPHQWAWV